MSLMSRTIHCFLAAADTLNFSEAARRMGISQQAVSKSISQLERELHVTLFRRSRHEVALTPAGEQLRILFTDTLDQLRSGIDAIQTHSEHRPDTLSVGYQNYLELTQLLSGSMTAIRVQHDGLSVGCERYSPAGLLDALESGRLDLIIICRRFLQDERKFHVRFLMQCPLLLLASAHFLRPDRPSSALRDIPLIIDRLEGESPAALDLRIQKELSHCRIAPPRIIVAPNRDSAYTSAEMGQGAVVCTALSRFRSWQGMRTHDLDVSDELVCCWRRSDVHPLAEEFVRHLRLCCIPPALSPE